MACRVYDAATGKRLNGRKPSKRMQEYLRRNQIHAKAVGAHANATAVLEHLLGTRKPPRWLVVAIRGIIERAEPVHHEMAAHRDEVSPYKAR
jgi:hypothetical protein